MAHQGSNETMPGDEDMRPSVTLALPESRKTYNRIRKLLKSQKRRSHCTNQTTMVRTMAGWPRPQSYTSSRVAKPCQSCTTMACYWGTGLLAHESRAENPS